MTKFVKAVIATAIDFVKRPAVYRKGYVVGGVGAASLILQVLGADSLLYHVAEAVLTFTGVVGVGNDPLHPVPDPPQSPPATP